MANALRKIKAQSPVLVTCWYNNAV